MDDHFNLTDTKKTKEKTNGKYWFDSLKAS